MTNFDSIPTTQLNIEETTPMHKDIVNLTHEERVNIATKNTDRLIELGQLDPKKRQANIDSYFPMTAERRAEIHKNFDRARGIS